MMNPPESGSRESIELEDFSEPGAQYAKGRLKSRPTIATVKMLIIENSARRFIISRESEPC
jgi:hypothetical protein